MPAAQFDFAYYAVVETTQLRKRARQYFARQINEASNCAMQIDVECEDV